MLKKIPGIEALVVNAIRQLQAVQGSTTKEITNFLAQQCNLSGPEIKRAIQLTIKRGLNYGILQRSKRGFVTCDRGAIPEPIEVLDLPECLVCKRSSCFGRNKRRGRSSARRRGLKSKRSARRSKHSKSRRSSRARRIKRKSCRSKHAVMRSRKSRRMSSKNSARLKRPVAKEDLDERHRTKTMPAAGHQTQPTANQNTQCNHDRHCA